MNQDNQNNEQKNEVMQLRNSELIKDSRQLFIFKKTEKIVSAIYLITESFTSNVPQLAEEMRSHVMKMLKKTLEVKSLANFEVNDVENLIKDYLFLRSLFSVAHQTRLVSDTNFSIVEFEMAGVLARLKSIIETPLSDSESDIFDEEFFAIRDEIDERADKEQVDKAQNKEKDSKDNQENLSNDFFRDSELEENESKRQEVSFKGQVKDINQAFNNNMSDREYSMSDTKRPSKEQVNISKDQADLKNANKAERLESIKGHLAKIGQSSIKDIYDSFDGVSEKTIQRDLQQLVQDGEVQKEGEKRWSTYQLA